MATLDEYEGTVTIDDGSDGPVTLGGFAAHDDRFSGRRSSLLATISDRRGSGHEYTVAVGADHFVQVYRGEDTEAPMPGWEAEAVLGEIWRRGGGFDAAGLLLEARSRALRGAPA